MAAEYEVNIKINSQQVERELKKIDKAVNNIGQSKGGKKQPILALPSTDKLFATTRGIKELDKYNRKIHLTQRQIATQTRDQALNVNTLVKTQEHRARLMNKINELESKGINVQKLRRQLAKGTTEQSARRFASADKEFRLLGKTIELEKSKLRILKQQQQGFVSSPVRGTATTMGSPAQIAASGRQLASPIRGGLSFPGSPLALAGRQVSRTPFGPSFPSGGAASPIRGGINFPESPIAIQAAKKTELRALKVQSSWAQALGELQETAQILKLKDARIKQSWVTALGELQETAQIFKSKDARIKQSWITALSALEDTAQIIKVRSQAASSGLTGQSSPIGGTASTPGSPAFLNRERRNKKLGQVGLGVGFPMLFGGGAGSVIGGGLGGLTGSFGAQIAFSAIGQQIDQMVASVMEAGKAFTSVGGAASFMAEKSLFSSDSMQFRIEKLIEEGKVTEAAALMTQEMAKQVGGSGLKALKDLGTEATKMGKLFGTVMLRIQAFMAKALAPLIALINRTIGGMVANDQLNQMLEEAGSPERRAKIEARANELRGTKKSGRKSRKKGDFTPDMLATLQADFPAIIPEGAEIKPTQLELLQAQDAGVSKRNSEAKQAARRLAASQERIKLLEIETTKIKDITGFKDRIAKAELDGRKELVVRINLEQKIAEINAKKDAAIEKLIGRDLPLEQQLREQIAIQAGADAQAAEAKAEAVRRLNVIQSNEDQRRLDSMKRLTEQQYKLNIAVQQQLALADGISQVMGQGMAQSFDLLITGADNWGNSLREIAANVLRDIARQLIQIYIIEQSISFLKNFLTPFNPATALGQGGGMVGRFGTLGPNYGIPQFADGGRPPVGRPSIVGERGPELFVPGASGTIIPNHAMGGANVTVNVDASGSSVEGDSDQASQLGKMLGAAVQAELIKQKRPGGLLSS